MDENILLCRKKKDVTVAVAILDFSLLCSSVQFNHSVVSHSLRPQGLQHTRPPCPSPTPWVYSESYLLSRWWHPTVSPSVVPSPRAFNHPQHQGLLKWVSSSPQVAKILEFQLEHQSLQWIFRTDFLYLSWLFLFFKFFWKFSLWLCIWYDNAALCVIAKFSKQLCFYLFCTYFLEINVVHFIRTWN